MSLKSTRTLPRFGKGYIPTLDGWRAVAISAVLLDHLGADLWKNSHPQLFAFTRTGPNGVSLFFAVSGFLICSRLIEEEMLLGSIDLKGFYIRRACRILPAAFLYLAVISIVGILGYLIVTRLELLSCVFFFRNYFSAEWIDRGWGGYTVHYWSLAVEEHFYLFWPAVMAWAGRRRARYVAGGLAVVVALWRWFDYRHDWIGRLIPGLLFPTRTDVRLDGLLLGCLAALLLADEHFRSSLNRRYVQVVWYMSAFAYVSSQLILRQHLYGIWESAFLATLVAGTVLNPERLPGRLLEISPLKWVGRLSYSLYLWQQLFLVAGALYPVSFLQRTPLNVILLFAMSYLSYRIVERPMIRLGHKLAVPPTPGRIDLVPAQ